MNRASANINLMIKAARFAAKRLLRDFGEVENLQVSQKSPSDFVSRADKKAEESIQTDLTEGRPNYGWLGEESGEKKGSDPTRKWIVDPLDGTTNFLHGIPHWAISIALEYKSEIVSAVVYDPLKDELFWAEKGSGCYMNEKRCRVSNRRNLNEMIFSTGIPFANRSGDLSLTLAELNNLMPECAGVRRLGAASLDLAYVASGRYDGFWERGLQSWDIAAGILLVKEAGGLIEPINIKNNVLKDGELIAGNEISFEKFSKIIRNH